MRRVLQGTRLRLHRFVRDGCSQLRAELRYAASTVGVGGSEGFETLVAAKARAFHAEVADEITLAVEVAATELGMAGLAIPSEPVRSLKPPDVNRTPSSSRRLEGRLMTVLGLGFGLGIALASSRLLAGVAPPGLSAAGSAAGAAAGLALLVWVVRARGLLHDRALLDRWVGEVAATLRYRGEGMVAERLLGAESALLAARSPGAPDGPTEHASVDGFFDAGLRRVDVTDQYEWC
jgi:hypothetical protein